MKTGYGVIIEDRYCKYCKKLISYKSEDGSKKYLKRLFCSNRCHAQVNTSLCKFQKGHLGWWKGKRRSPEFCKMITQVHKGKKLSEETKEKLRQYRGALRHNWNGGISFEYYPPEFNKALKELVRQRDNYKCQLCGVPQIECIRKLSVHHINYDRYDNDIRNLISLCQRCHRKLGFRRGKLNKNNRFLFEQAYRNTYNMKGAK